MLSVYLFTLKVIEKIYRPISFLPKKMFIFQWNILLLGNFISALQFSLLEHKVNTNIVNNFSMGPVLFYKYLP